MWSGVIDTESLINPTIVNQFQATKVIVEYEPNSDANKYHHVFFLQIKSTEVKKTIERIAKEMKGSWFAFFWNDKDLMIVFNRKTFKVSQVDSDYSQAKEYGRSVGIQEEFLDFKTYFDRYKKISV